MKKLAINITIELYPGLDDVPINIQSLMSHAVDARHKAYAPYSNFTVGCALQLENGIIITGNNQENAAYPSGLCAERVAIYAAGANYPGVAIKHLALTASPINDTLQIPVPPCGACRQAIAEYENRQQEPITIYFMGASGTIAKAQSLKDLLPLVFDQSFL